MGFIDKSGERKKLTAEMFDYIARFYLKRLKKISDDRILCAREIMVEQKSPSEVAAKLGFSRQSASNNVDLVWTYYLFDKDLAKARGETTAPIHVSEEPAPKNIVIPNGWAYAGFLVPKDTLEKVKEMIKRDIKQ